MGVFDMIKRLVSKDTKYVKCLTDTDGNIEELTVTYLDSPNAVGFGTNLLLQNILQNNYGIGVADILPSNLDIQTTEHRVIDLQPILKQFPYDECPILQGLVLVPVMDYIFLKFQIVEWSDFIDTIYKNLRQIIYTGQTRDKINVLFKMDKQTNEMINVLACTIGRYKQKFADIPIGETTVIPNQRYTTKAELEEILYKLFFDMGLIDENTTITIPSAMWSGNDSSRAYLNQKNYATVLIHKGLCDNPLNVVYPTNPNFHEMWTYTIVTSTDPVTSLVLDGFTYTSSNTWDITDAGSSYNTLFCWQTTFNIAIENSGTNSVFSMMKAFEIGTSENVLNLVYKNYSSFRWGDYYSGDRTKIYLPLPWKWYRLQGTATWPDIQTADQITTDIYLNCSYVDQNSLIAPLVDALTEVFLTANDIELQNDVIGDMVNIVANGLNMGMGTIPKTTPFDTTHSLKIATIDKTNKRTVDTNSYVTDFIKTNRPSLLSLWQNKLIEADIEPPSRIGFVKQYYLPSDTEMQLIAQDLWELSFFESLFKRDPMECIMKLFALPFVLQPGDYHDYNSITASKAGIACTADGQVPIVYGNAVVHKAHGYELGSSTTKIWFDLAPIKLNENFTDYEPYTKAVIWLPFIGYRPIDTSLIINQQLKCIYTININTGDFIVRLYSANVIDGVVEMDADVSVVDVSSEVRDPQSDDTLYIGSEVNYCGNPILYESGNMAYPLMLTGQYNNANQILDSALKGIGNTIIGVGQGGVIGGVVSGTMSAFNTAVIASQGNAVQSKGGVGGGSNWMGHSRPYITIYYHQTIDDMQVGTVFDETVGHKSSYGLRIQDMEAGYHKLKSIKLDGLRCTLSEKEKIKEILMGGFYNGLSKKRVKV